MSRCPPPCLRLKEAGASFSQHLETAAARPCRPKSTCVLTKGWWPKSTHKHRLTRLAVRAISQKRFAAEDRQYGTPLLRLSIRERKRTQPNQRQGSYRKSCHDNECACAKSRI